MNRSSLTFADVALLWLRFPRRIGAIVQAPGRRLAANGRVGFHVLDDPIVAEFVDSIALRVPSRTIDEVEHIVADFLARYPDLLAWWDAVLRDNRIDFFFDNAEPRIEVGDIVAWRELTAKLDPDALVAFVFAQRYRRRCRFEDLSGWGTVVGTQSPDIRRVFLDPRIRIYETHVHLEGCEPVPLLWRRVLSGELRPHDFEQYRKGANHGVARLASFDEDGEGDRADRDLRWEIRHEMRQIGDALRARSEIAAAYPELSLRSSTPHADDFLSLNVAQLWPERQFLTGSWNELHRLQTADSGRWSPDMCELAKAFDRYTLGKSAFMSRLVQGPLSNPGLAAFKRYFRRGKILPKVVTRGSKNPVERKGPSRRLMWERWSRMGRYATENKGLAGIEMRIAPFPQVRDYVRFFEDFEKRRHEFLAHPGIDVSFIVHFIRQEASSPYLQAYKSSVRPYGHGMHLSAAAIDDLEARRSLDRQSAVLHRFRVEYPKEARWIVGIDVANVERRNPVHLSSPYLRLLRLRSDDDTPEGPGSLYRRWIAMRRRHGPIVPTGLSPLGLTFHVGEDFFHPLEGVKAIWEYMNFCNVRSGDRIGHGLALGVDIRRFNEERGRSAVMPRGEALDLLVWIRHRLVVLSDAAAPAIRKVDDDISALSLAVYRHPHPPHELYELIRARHYMRRDAGPTMSEGVARLLELEYDPVVRRERNRYETLPKSLLDTALEPHLTVLQLSIVDEVIDRELYVETNPTSNLNILSLASLGDHPIFRLLKQRPSLKVTVNTDDPGTFATSLELEYALARQALRANDVEDVEAVLERFAAMSEKAAFGTPPQNSPLPHRQSPSD